MMAHDQRADLRVDVDHVKATRPLRRPKETP
jgi:hypothetical protein